MNLKDIRHHPRSKFLEKHLDTVDDSRLFRVGVINSYNEHL